MLRMCRTRLKSYTSVTGTPRIYILHTRGGIYLRRPRGCVHTKAENTPILFFFPSRVYKAIK